MEPTRPDGCALTSGRRHHVLVTVRVGDAESDEDLDEVRRLFREFVVWHRARQGQNADLLAAYFDDAGWQAELDGLPGAYAATEGGALLLATSGSTAVGCGALRQLNNESCEMKRMYVDDAGRGQGVGRVLGEAMVDGRATSATPPCTWTPAWSSTRRSGCTGGLGFEEIEPYYDVAPDMRGWLAFFRLVL